MPDGGGHVSPWPLPEIGARESRTCREDGRMRRDTWSGDRRGRRVLIWKDLAVRSEAGLNGRASVGRIRLEPRQPRPRRTLLEYAARQARGARRGCLALDVPRSRTCRGTRRPTPDRVGSGRRRGHPRAAAGQAEGGREMGGPGGRGGECAATIRGYGIPAGILHGGWTGGPKRKTAFVRPRALAGPGETRGDTSALGLWTW